MLKIKNTHPSYQVQANMSQHSQTLKLACCIYREAR